MEKQVINVPGLFDAKPLGFEHCVTAGDLVFVAGQGGLDEQARLVSPEFEPQARRALECVRAALQAAGAGARDVTAVTVYLTDMSHLRTFSTIRREVLPEMEATSTAVEVSKLAISGMLVEVTVMAVRSRS